MTEICERCGGSGLDPHHPKIYDTPAGQYTDDMDCPSCGGTGEEKPTNERAEGARMSDQDKGLYQKYIVARRDGSSAPGGKHEHDVCFVLNLTTDKFAVLALDVYADECADEYPLLASDLRLLVERFREKEGDQ